MRGGVIDEDGCDSDEKRNSPLSKRSRLCKMCLEKQNR